jgi:hypothetical protein
LRELSRLHLCKILPHWHGFHCGSSALARSRPSTTSDNIFKYNIHPRIIVDKTLVPLTRDILVLAWLDSPTMPPTATGSGKYSTTFMDDLAKRPDRLEEVLCGLTGKVGDID